MSENKHVARRLREHGIDPSIYLAGYEKPVEVAVSQTEITVSRRAAKVLLPILGILLVIVYGVFWVIGVILAEIKWFFSGSSETYRHMPDPETIKGTVHFEIQIKR